MRSPDRWATEIGRRRSGVAAWHESVPNEVRQLVAVSTIGAEALAEWFRTEVAASYPDAIWPAEATYAKVVKLIAEVRRASA